MLLKNDLNPDAAQEYGAVKQDIETYYELLKPGGFMIGDDYSPAGWPGVVRAVNEFSKKNSLSLKLSGVVWMLQKPALL